MLIPYEMAGFGMGRASGGPLYMPSGTLIANWDEPGSVGLSGTMVNIAGAGATSLITGNLDVAANLRLRCALTTGAFGTAKIQASFDGGQNWGAELLTSEWMNIGNDVQLLYTSTTSFNSSYVAVPSIRTFTDRSGNGYHDVQTTAANQPTTCQHNGRGVGISGPSFDARTTLPWSSLFTALSNGGAVNGAWSVFVAGKRTSDTVNTVFMAGTGSSNFPIQFGFGGTVVGDRKLRVSKKGSGDGSAILVETGHVIPSGSGLFAAGAVVSGTSVSFYVYPSTTPVSGPTSFSSAAGTISTPTSAATGFGGTGAFRSEIYARLVANVAYSTGDIQAIWDSMTARWGAF